MRSKIIRFLLISITPLAVLMSLLLLYLNNKAVPYNASLSFYSGDISEKQARHILNTLKALRVISDDANILVRAKSYTKEAIYDTAPYSRISFIMDAKKPHISLKFIIDTPRDHKTVGGITVLCPDNDSQIGSTIECMGMLGYDE